MRSDQRDEECASSNCLQACLMQKRRRPWPGGVTLDSFQFPGGHGFNPHRCQPKPRNVFCACLSSLQFHVAKCTSADFQPILSGFGPQSAECEDALQNCEKMISHTFKHLHEFAAQWFPTNQQIPTRGRCCAIGKPIVQSSVQ